MPHILHDHVTSHAEPLALVPRRGWLTCKRILDPILGLVGTLLVLPLLAVLWAVVRLSSRGPGFYSQRRSGWKSRVFSIYKLRTMTHDCEKSTGAVWAQKSDPRITLIGRFLRNTHLDELPQLGNVLRGDMLLVGPRPERPEIIERILLDVPDYNARLQVPPGVTGLAQIFAEPDLTIADVQRKLCYDRYYIRHMSPWLDARIILCTLLKVVGLNTASLRAALFPGATALALPQHQQSVAEPRQPTLTETV